MKAVVGAKKEFIDAYIAQLYKSFNVKPVNEEVDSNDPYEMIAALKKIKGVQFAELDGKNITFNFKNEDFLLKNKRTFWDLLVNGYKKSLLVDQELTTAEEVVKAAKNVNAKWFKENDPDGHGM